MKENELRIGNYAIDYITEKELMVSNLWSGVKGIRSPFDSAGETGNYYVFFTGAIDKHGRPYVTRSNAKDVLPIPLTEEWLMKLGFKRYKADFEVEKDEKQYVINDCFNNKLSDHFRIYWRSERQQKWHREIWSSKANDIGSDYFIYVGGYVKSVQYIHQLQNLYFSLTGEELELKS
jgi:hypothetical protein